MKLGLLFILFVWSLFIYWKLADLTNYKIAICVFLLVWINNKMVEIAKQIWKDEA